MDSEKQKKIATKMLVQSFTSSVCCSFT